MTKVDVYNITGEKVGQHDLDEKVFNVAVNELVVHQVMVAQQANSRQVVAHTKNRADVRGGGKKPWKQKGTGRARAGSSRSPLWRGGGITFGPRSDRNFSLLVNKKMKNKALRMVLSDKAANGHLILIDTFALEQPKTSTVAAMLKKLPVENKKVLVSFASKDEALLRSVRNLEKIGYIAADSLNVVDLLRYDYLMLDKAAVEKIVTVFGK